MTSSQNQRYQERLAARQRGAGTHKIVDVGFSIQPPGRPPALATTQSPPPPKVLGPKPATPTSGPPPRRSSRSASRTSSPATGGTASTVQKPSGSPPLREEITASPGAPVQPGSSIAAVRQTSPRGFGTLAVGALSSNASSVSRIGTPTGDVLASRASTRSTITRASAVAAVTPVTRGKRTRQPSPDKFLTTPEAVGITNKLEGKARANPGQRYQERIAVRQRGAGTHKIVDLDFTIQPIALPSVPGAERRIVVEAEVVGEAMEAVEEEETIEQAVQIVEGGVEDEDEDPSIAIKGPASGNKRRKVVLEESEQDESHSGRGKDQEAQPPGQTEEGKGAKFSQPRHKRETAGKWPASPKIPEDVGNEGKEVVSQSSEVQEEQEVESELRDDQEEVVVVDSRPLGRSSMGSKGFTNPRTKAKPKPHRRAQRQDNEDGDEATNFTFPVIVHRLGKSQVFTLPPGSQRGGVNPIDVISQVSMELVDKYFHKMKSSTERKAVESYKEELSLRFLELTDVLEHNIVLTARARQAQKRKTDLMTELLSIKQDRAKVAVKMDDVRKAHELATKTSDNQQHISRTFADITGTLERGKARQLEDREPGMDGLEALVRRLSTTVTGGGRDGTGLLATVVEFNKFLERAESALRDKRH